MSVSLGFVPGQVVQEFYYDDDVDEALRELVAKETGNQLVDIDYGDVVDGVLVWWRAEDADEEDLADVLVDAGANLDDGGGVVWVCIPKPGRSGSVEVGEVEDAARTAGLQATSAASVGSDWAGMRLTARARNR